MNNTSPKLPKFQPHQFSERQQKHVTAGVAMLEKILAESPGSPEILHNLSLMLLSALRFSEGWPLSEHRLKDPRSKFSYDYFPVDRWDGGSLAGKDVLVWLEQGVGDQIMAASLLADVAAEAKSVVLLCDPLLAPIFKRSFPTIQVYRVGWNVPRRLEVWDFDCQLSFGDLGQRYRQSEEDFPSGHYLKAPPSTHDIDYHRFRAQGRKMIGLAWASESKVCADDKSIPPEALHPLLQMEDFYFVNMQYGDLGKLQHQNLNPGRVNQLLDMDLFSAEVMAMDAIVSSSQTLVHLAGALGKETLALVPIGKGRHWYWTYEMERSLWYPSVHVINQKAAKDWSAPIAEAMTALRGMK